MYGYVYQIQYEGLNWYPFGQGVASLGPTEPDSVGPLVDRRPQPIPIH